MKRKTINFLMLMAIMLSFIFKGNLYAGTKDTVSRDTILVMDVSYSMWGRPLEVMKKMKE